MRYKKTKRIPQELSAVGIGCWNFGGDWDFSDDGNSERVILKAVDRGVNLFDVAPVYGFFHSEELLGRVMKQHGLRDRVFLATKCGLTWGEDRVTRNDLSRNSILREIDDSLRRLQTEYVDLYQLHWPDPATPIEETAETLREIRAAGKIRYIGLSNFSISDTERFEALVGVDCLQGLYNMLERNTDSYHGIPLAYHTEDEMLSYAAKHGQAFLPYSPLFQGVLSGNFHPKDNFSNRDIRNQNPKLSPENFRSYYNAVQELNRLAKEFGKPLNEIAFNWLRQKPEVTSIIAGADSPEQLEANLRCLDWELSPDQMTAIHTVIDPFRYQ